MAFTACLGWKDKDWRGRAIILPAIRVAAFLLYKNGFVRSDHSNAFFVALPLLLAVWCIGWQGSADVRILVAGSVLYPLALLVAQTPSFGRSQFFETIPVVYFKQAVDAPMQRTSEFLQYALQANYPRAILPTDIRDRIGKASVDVMPMELSIAILNGLNYKPRPIPQSYCAYTPWLDRLNAEYFSSNHAPEYILYACDSKPTIDDRPSAWDESLTKKAVLENYTFDSQFALPIINTDTVFLLKKTERARRLVLVKKTDVKFGFKKPFLLPRTDNLIFLKLNVQRSIPGMLEALATLPTGLKVKFEYEDGTSMKYRAILPILQTGVLINRRVESIDEIGHWLKVDTLKSQAVRSISFETSASWAFQTPLKGSIEEFRLEK